ncbi:MAG: ATP-binding protein [Patescibacteria group bacterium]|nr:ATP-binding protein [Patescibacteria group bacterium]
MKKIKELSFYLGLPGMRIAWITFALLAVSLALLLLKTANWALFLAALLMWLVIFGNSLRSTKLNLEVESAAKRMESIISNLSDGIIFYDENFKIIIFNLAAEKIFRVERKDVIGKTFGPELAVEPKWKLLAQTLFPSLAPIVVWRSETGVYPQVADVSFADPAVDLRVTTDRLFDSARKIVGFVKIVHDRTAEIQLAKSESEFVTITAHQLRTPLTGINWSLESISSDPEAGKNTKDLAETAKQAAAKLLKTVDDLLNVSKMESGALGYAFEDVNLINFINSQLNGFLPTAASYGVSLYFDKGGAESVPVRIDVNRLGLAFANLLDNAIKYNNPNGSVTVKVERQKDGPYVLVTVSDTGIGIPPEALKKLFVKFFRAENAIGKQTEGTGLGLYMTKGIIERHGGKIWADSVLGRGTNFHFTLPLDFNLIPPKETISLL